MTREEAKSCIGTIEMLQRLAYNIHGVMDVIDADNCKKIIKALEQEPKTGRWIDNNNGAISCNYCHTWFNKGNRYSYMHYCPNCGARMESEDKECI